MGRNYRGARYAGVSAPGETFTGIEFEECIFDRANFAGCTFARCKFMACRFTACDLSNIRVLNSTFNDVTLERSKVVGVDWTKAGSSALTRLLLSLRFTDCVLDYCNFFGLHLREMQLVRCRIHHGDFSEADLAHAVCGGSDFLDSIFLHTNLEHADFVGATNYAIDPTANRVKQARFSLPEAVALLRGFDIVIEV